MSISNGRVEFVHLQFTSSERVYIITDFPDLNADVLW
jgi:hypothetical protein